MLRSLGGSAGGVEGSGSTSAYGGGAVVTESPSSSRRRLRRGGRVVWDTARGANAVGPEGVGMVGVVGDVLLGAFPTDSTS